MTEQSDENNDLIIGVDSDIDDEKDNDDTDIDISKFISFIRKIDDKIDLRMVIIFLLFLMIAILYFYYQKDMTACNEYYKAIIEQQNFIEFF